MIKLEYLFNAALEFRSLAEVHVIFATKKLLLMDYRSIHTPPSLTGSSSLN